MSFYDVLQRGDDFIKAYRPTSSKLWNYASQMTCLAAVGGSKLCLTLFYDVKLKGINNLDKGLAKARKENRGFVTIMNHMSVCDDPFLWGCLPWRYYFDLDDIRWGLAASNVCFKSEGLSRFFSLGKIFPCDRFGRGPFQGGLDACIRALSPDDTLDTEHIFQDPKAEVQIASLANLLVDNARSFYSKSYTPPILRYKTSWVHLFPEGYVCQLQAPYNNSMRFFRWGTARMILEPTVAPVIVPIFSDGFEKIVPETKNDGLTDSFVPPNMGATITVNIGKPLEDKIIESFRDEWKKLCDKFYDKGNPNDLSFELKFGKEAKELRSRVCAYLREKVAQLRSENGFEEEDPRFKSVDWWKKYTYSQGASDPDVKFVGLNWAVKSFQKHVPVYDKYGNIVEEPKKPSN